MPNPTRQPDGKPADSAAAATVASRASQPSQAVATDRLSPEERHVRISRAAYRRAESRGFIAGGELEDWLSAEREVDSHTAG